MLGLRMRTIQKAVNEALTGLEVERDRNGSMAVKEALKHLLTAELWLSREAAHQENKNE